jgi:ribonuclease T1
VRRFAAFLRLALFLALVGVFGVNTGAQGREYYQDKAVGSLSLAELPPEAEHTLLLIRRGGPFPYPHKDGATFGNFEQRLPAQVRGYYREYTVPTPGSRDRGARRIIAGSGRSGDAARSGEYYYTGDHYRSFYRIREP